MGYMQHGSHWLFQIRMADDLYASGEATARAATELFSRVLRDPLPDDWAKEPMESLASMTTPHPMVFEHWFDVAMDRKETQTAVEVAERIRRHRFLTSLEMGGRLESLRWLLESPSRHLPAVRPGATPRHSRSLSGLRQTVASSERPSRVAPFKSRWFPNDAEAIKEQTKLLNELASLSARQEAILREIALRREPATIAFPPLKSLAEVQKAPARKNTRHWRSSRPAGACTGP